MMNIVLIIIIAIWLIYAIYDSYTHRYDCDGCNGNCGKKHCKKADSLCDMYHRDYPKK